jgi:hypothetical protein
MTPTQKTPGEDMYRQSRTDPKEHCKTYMRMGFRTIRTLHSIAKETPEILVKKQNILTQLVQNCLNVCLDRLVGPKCLKLRGTKEQGARDFEEYEFKHKELLAMVCEMYLLVSEQNSERVIKIILDDPRVYQSGAGGMAEQAAAANAAAAASASKETAESSGEPGSSPSAKRDANESDQPTGGKTFTKAERILRRAYQKGEMILPKEKIEAFSAFIKTVLAAGKQHDDAMEDVEIPDE